MGSAVINLLRQQERKARLRFWQMLALVSRQTFPNCPFCSNSLPQGTIYIGVMPEYLRCVFVRAYNLRSEDRKSEAEVYEEAVNDLMQEHFRKVLMARKLRGEPEIGHFILSKNWSVYAMPLR